MKRWSEWREHFEAQCDRPLPKIAVEEHPVEIARSLAIFQRGEAGEGRIAKEIWKAALPGIDDDYRRALGLFVAEEGRHARILATAVRAMGGSLLERTWTEGFFVRGRRLAGVRLKLLVLAVAEIVGITFYALIAETLEKGRIRSALEEIIADEAHHLEFHADFFRSQVQPESLEGLVFRAVFAAVGRMACETVIYDHRRTLSALGIPGEVARARFVALLDRNQPGGRRFRRIGLTGGNSMSSTERSTRTRRSKG